VKPLIVGEAPSKNEHVPRPISGRIGRRLAACAGMTLERFLASFDRVNLLEVRQDTKEKGFEFDVKAALASARMLRDMMFFKHRPAILLLGTRVARAFEVKANYFDEFTLCDAKAYMLPHPSGINRWWNDPDNDRKMHEFMQWLVVECKL
jgi:uracil-DNA glycosylase